MQKDGVDDNLISETVSKVRSMVLYTYVFLIQHQDNDVTLSKMRAEISGSCQKVKLFVIKIQYKKNFEIWKKFSDENFSKKTYTHIYGKDSIDQYIESFKEVLGWIPSSKIEDLEQAKTHEKTKTHKKSTRTFKKKYNTEPYIPEDRTDDYVIGKNIYTPDSNKKHD